MKTYEYIRLNDEPIEIEFIEDEHDEENDFLPSFWYNNQRYFLRDFIRVHNNPWWGCSYDFPEYIHGILDDGSALSYREPFYIEIVDGERVNVYRESEVTE